MCNCRQLPPWVAEIESIERGFAFSGALIHKHYFETPESDYLEPQLDYSHSRYRCLECGQEWYIECSPEQTPFPAFAFKVNELMRLPSENEVQAAKQYLCILAHGGFSSEKCRMAGCKNHKVLGRELCHLHIPFP
ncbi:hypothetical protein EGO56_14220 [Pantoea vagans]|nr:hypothetical protein EGO56_14220 [Pantoea vagans]